MLKPIEEKHIAHAHTADTAQIYENVFVHRIHTSAWVVVVLMAPAPCISYIKNKKFTD